MYKKTATYTLMMEEEERRRERLENMHPRLFLGGLAILEVNVEYYRKLMRDARSSLEYAYWNRQYRKARNRLDALKRGEDVPHITLATETKPPWHTAPKPKPTPGFFRGLWVWIKRMFRRK